MLRWSLTFLTLLTFGFPVAEAQSRKKNQGRYLRLRVNLTEVQPGKWAPNGAAAPGGAGGGGESGQSGGGAIGGLPPGYPGGGEGAGQQTEEPAKSTWVEARFWARYGNYHSKNPNSPYYVIQHDFGISVVPTEFVTAYCEKHPRQWFQDERYKLSNLRKASLENYEAVVLGAIQRGLPEKAIGIIEDAKKERNFESKEFSLFLKTLEAIKKKPKQTDPGARALISSLSSKYGYRPVTSSGGHFVLLTSLPPNDPEVTVRLEKLELLYTSFFGWFALKGIEIPQPNYRLVCVLEHRNELFRKVHNDYFTTPLHSNQFVLPRTNVAYLYQRPRIPTYTKLKSINESYWESKTWSAKVVLDAGNVENAQAQVDGASQILGIIQKAMEERAKVEAVTYAGTRQLLAATGLLPQNVLAGEWIRTGMARFFGTSRDAFYQSSALPNWKEYIDFRDFQRLKKIPTPKNPQACGETMLKVVTDRFFHDARTTVRLRDQLKNPKEREKATALAKEQLTIARATSWALTHYMLNQKLDTLLGYFHELRQLPRDVEYDAPVLANSFAHAWGSPFSHDQAGMNSENYATPGRDWIYFVTRSQYPVWGLRTQLIREREEAEQEAKGLKKKKKAPAPAYPGAGTPGPGGIPSSGCGN
ncbi:MAG: hypothetical protein ACFCD0_00035 [Gemmataceae bacterium]